MMNRFATVITIIFILFGMNTIATAASGPNAAATELMNRFAKINSFTGEFQQKVLSPKKEILVTSNGTLAISRPNLFRWYTKVPDENLIVSDGGTVWFYDVAMAQVTAMRFIDATAQTPFILLTNTSPEAWDKYNITRKDDDFTLIPRSKKENINTLYLTVDNNGFIKKFTLIDKDKQRNEFVLSNVRPQPMTRSRFDFVVPRGVDLDDQRK